MRRTDPSRPLHYAALFGLPVLLSLLVAACAARHETSLSALHHFNRGNAAYAAEDFRRAITHYQRAVDFDESAADIHYNLGLAYYRAETFEEAARSYHRAIELDPLFADAHLNLALAYDKLYNLEAAHHHYNTYRKLLTEAAARTREADARISAPPARGNVPAGPAGQAQRGGPQGRQFPANPFQGNSKWWIQDPANKNR
ncbi:MAG: tetratricopeptide repeat protein [SAR324 cluster bacterium]|nr:tetratricopeptide repeat protein [SAR324 cluster bacterium]